MSSREDTLNHLLVWLMKDIMEIEEKFLISGEFKDITNNDMHIIEAIGISEPKNMSTVAKSLSVTIGTLTIAMNNLVKKGYVVCRRDEKDRRYVKYQLTEASEQIRMEIDDLWSELLSKIVSGIDEESFEVFNQVAKQINENIDYLLENE